MFNDDFGKMYEFPTIAQLVAEFLKFSTMLAPYFIKNKLLCKKCAMLIL